MYGFYSSIPWYSIGFDQAINCSYDAEGHFSRQGKGLHFHEASMRWMDILALTSALIVWSTAIALLMPGTTQKMDAARINAGTVRVMAIRGTSSIDAKQPSMDLLHPRHFIQLDQLYHRWIVEISHMSDH